MCVRPTAAATTTVLPIPPCGPKLLRAARSALYAPYRAARMENGPHGRRTGHTETRATPAQLAKFKRLHNARRSPVTGCRETLSRQESPAHKETLELRKFRTQADRKKEREGENAEKQGEGRESGGPRKEGRRGRGCWERRRESRCTKRLSAAAARKRCEREC